MIVGIGLDVASIDRLGAALTRTPSLRARLFDPVEAELPLESLAGRFAAKEAVAKALGSPPGLRWTDAVVARGEHGRPELEIRGGVADRAAELGVTHWHLSITHDAGVAAAYVVAERRE